MHAAARWQLHEPANLGCHAEQQFRTAAGFGAEVRVAQHTTLRAIRVLGYRPASSRTGAVRCCTWPVIVDETTRAPNQIRGGRGVISAEASGCGCAIATQSIPLATPFPRWKQSAAWWTRFRIVPVVCPIAPACDAIPCSDPAGVRSH